MFATHLPPLAGALFTRQVHKISLADASAPVIPA